jgi:hypothetical protein
VKTTINIKKENIISACRVIDMDKLVNKDFYNIIKNKVPLNRNQPNLPEMFTGWSSTIIVFLLLI